MGGRALTVRGNAAGWVEVVKMLFRDGQEGIDAGA
jgi:hypothetical protein